MAQEIITYLLVAYAFGYTAWGFWGIIRGTKKTACSGGCGSASCASKSILMKEVSKGSKPFLVEKFGF